MKKNEPTYIFGPVPSRRLGRSLGVDVVPFKTCSYDCIYCQLGRTTNKTIERKEYASLKVIIDEIGNKLKHDPLPDYITISGSGEPTLYSELSSLIQGIKQITEILVVVLTNGSLLWDKGVQKSICDADLVIPSLDAGDETEFQCVNRPHTDISFEKMVHGLMEFRQAYNGALWLETFLLQGTTATESSVKRIAAYAEKINPDKIQLNTVARPPAEEFAFAVSEERMSYFAPMFGEKAEVIADYRNIHDEETFSVSREEVFTLLKRRPCSLEDIAFGLSIHRNEAIKHIQELMKEDKIKTETGKNSRFFKVV